MKKKVRAICVSGSLLVAAMVSMLLGGSGMAADTEKSLFTPSVGGYAVLWSNAQQNSLVRDSVTARGRLQWQTSYDSFGTGAKVSPRFVLAADGRVAVQCQEHLLLVGAGGEAHSRVGIDGLCPVVLGESTYVYADFSDQLAYQQYDGVYLVEGHSIPRMKERSRLLSLRPLGNDVLSAVQYAGGIERPDDPARFSACRFKLGTAFWEWLIEDRGYLVSTLITPDDSLIVLVRAGRVEIYQTADGEKTGEFETGFARAYKGSLDSDGRLAVMGEGEEDTDQRELRVFDLQGKLLWKFELASTDFKQPPACGPKGMIYIINMGQVQALRDGEVVWEDSTLGGPPKWLTTTSTGQVVAVHTDGMTVFEADGTRRFDFETKDIEDQFLTPAAIDSSGRILVAGKKALYCFD